MRILSFSILLDFEEFLKSWPWLLLSVCTNISLPSYKPKAFDVSVVQLLLLFVKIRNLRSRQHEKRTFTHLCLALFRSSRYLTGDIFFKGSVLLVASFNCIDHLSLFTSRAMQIWGLVTAVDWSCDVSSFGKVVLSEIFVMDKLVHICWV